MLLILDTKTGSHLARKSVTMKPIRTILILVLILLLSLLAGAQEKYSTVKIYAPSDKTLKAKLIGLLQIDHFQELEKDVIIAEISSRDIAQLKRTPYSYEILVDDVARRLDELNREYYAKQANGTGEQRLAFEQTGRTVGNIIPTPSDFVVQPTFGGYYSFTQMEAAMNALVAEYPTIASKTSLGTSHEGRDIWCIKISDQVATDQANEPEVLFMGLQHAREAIGGSSMIFLMQYLCENYATNQQVKDIVDNREIFIIPCMNPDGWEYNRLNGGAGSGWRKNRRDNAGTSWGVDLNRNWGIDWSNCSSPIIGDPSSCGSNDGFDDTYYGPSAFSEPETQAVRDFTYSHHLVAMIDQHAYGPYYSLPFGRPSLSSNVMPPLDQKFYDYIAAAMGNYNGMRAGNSPQALGYEVAGGVKDWMLKGNIGTGTKGKVYGMTGEGGAGGGTSGSFGSFWAPASQIVNLCKGMTFQNLQLLYAAGSYVNLQDKTDIALNSRTGTFDFRITRVGLANQPVTISVVPMENIEFVGTIAPINSLSNLFDTYNGSINYTLRPNLADGQRVRFAWKIETGGYTYYDTITKFYNPIEVFRDDMEGSSVTTEWTVTGGWNYTTEDSYTGSKSLTESPGGNYTANSTRRATYNGVIDLGDATAGWLSFWVKHRAENFYDKLQVMVSANLGASWTAIPGTTTIQEPGTLDGSTINGRPSLTGIKEEWTRELFDLVSYLNVPNLMLRFEFTSGPASSYDFSEDDGFHIDDIKIVKATGALISLDSRFLNFTGYLQENEVHLDWKVLSDDRYDYFEVEKSANGTSFISIGRVAVGSAYFKIDPAPYTGDNFYRIKQVNKDGTITYSNTINVYYNPSKVNISVYPNPFDAVLHVKVNSKADDQYSVNISDITGSKVYEARTTAGHELTIDFRNKAAQVYMLVIRNNKNEIISTQKVVKQQ